MTLRSARPVFTIAFVFFSVFVLQAQAPVPSPSGTSGAIRPAGNVKVAEQVYKDIQVLKGVPADQIMPAMQFMNVALGVQCEHCHLPGVYEAPNSNKNTARDMIKMQFELTNGIFENVRLATCWTCHRGSIDPQTLPIVAGGTAAASEREGQRVRVTITPDEVFDKWTKATGGTEAWTKIKTEVEAGTVINGGMKSPLTVIAKAPDKIMTVVRAADGETVSAFDGHNAWQGSVGRSATPMAAEDAYATTLDAQFMFPATAKKAFTRMRMWRPEKINAHDTNVVLGMNRGQADAKLYFDKDSGLLIRMVRYIETPLGQIPIQVDYEDYRASGDVRMPHRWTVARPEGKFTVQIERVQQNVAIDDAKFAQPVGRVTSIELQ